VIADLLDAGADPQSLSDRLQGPPEPGDEDLVWLWVRRPVIEWALRRAAAAQDGIELLPGVQVAGLLTSENGARRATGVQTADGEEILGDIVVDALGRYRCPRGWPRPDSEPMDSGAIYYCRYFELAGGVEHMDAPILNPRGDLGYMGFNTFRGDNRTFAVILLAPAADRDLRVLRHDEAWRAACAAITPLDVLTSEDYGRPITDVMPMGGLMNVDRTTPPDVAGVAAVGDALCHTDPAFAYGLSFSLVHATALAEALSQADVDSAIERYYASVQDEARERYRLVCETDDARARRWSGEALDISRADGCYPLFAFAAALAAAPHDDDVLRRSVRRLGLLDRTAAFDDDVAVHRKIEEIFRRVMSNPPPPPGPPRGELLERVTAIRAGAGTSTP
jgi:2-polyprenyl-6-methoxyphenol hydroxylase-like FAD-dependent oxidoreductase